MPKVLVGAVLGGTPPMFELKDVPKVKKKKKKIILTAKQVVGDLTEAHEALIGRHLRVVLWTELQFKGETVHWIGVQGNAPVRGDKREDSRVRRASV